MTALQGKQTVHPKRKQEAEALTVRLVYAVRLRVGQSAEMRPSIDQKVRRDALDCIKPSFQVEPF
jgi:hypothetical protein